jgi:hypothetical protein
LEEGDTLVRFVFGVLQLNQEFVYKSTLETLGDKTTTTNVTTSTDNTTSTNALPEPKAVFSNLTNFSAIQHLSKVFTIKKLIVNNTGLAFAVIVTYIKRGFDLCIPVEQILVPNKKFEEISYLQNSVFEKISYSNVLAFLGDLRLASCIKYFVVDSNEDVFCLKVFQKFFYFNKVRLEKLKRQDTEIRKINFVYYDLFNAIKDEKFTLNINDDVYYETYILYYKNLYKLLVQQIAIYFSSKYNTTIRSVLLDTIYKNQRQILFFNNSSLTALFDKYSFSVNDRYLLYHIINIDLENYIRNKSIEVRQQSAVDKRQTAIDLNVDEIKEILQNYRFDFDDIEKKEFLSNPTYTETLKLVDSLCEAIPKKDLYCSEHDPLTHFDFREKPAKEKKCILNKAMENFLLPCLKNESGIYCRKQKLLIPAEEKNTLIKMLVRDVQNPLVHPSILFSKRLISSDKNIYNVGDNEELIIDRCL